MSKLTIKDVFKIMLYIYIYNITVIDHYSEITNKEKDKNCKQTANSFSV